MEPSTTEDRYAAAHAAVRELMARAVLFQEAVARSVGLNSSDLQAVGLLMSQGPATPSALAATLGLTQGGAITGLVDRLERAGYVRRTRDGADRRKVLVVADADRVMADVGPVYARVALRWEEYLSTLDDAQVALCTQVMVAAAEINRTEVEALRTGGSA